MLIEKGNQDHQLGFLGNQIIIGSIICLQYVSFVYFFKIYLQLIQFFYLSFSLYALYVFFFFSFVGILS